VELALKTCDGKLQSWFPNVYDPLSENSAINMCLYCLHITRTNWHYHNNGVAVASIDGEPLGNKRLFWIWEALTWEGNGGPDGCIAPLPTTGRSIEGVMGMIAPSSWC